MRQKAKKSERCHYTALLKTNPNQFQSGLCQVPNRETLTLNKLTKESFLFVFAPKRSHPNVTAGEYYPTGCTTFQ